MSLVLRVIGIIFIFSFIIFFTMFFKYVSIGEKITKENYIIDGKLDYDSWLWNLGIFIAIMMGFSNFISFASDLAFPKKVENNKEKTKK